MCVCVCVCVCVTACVRVCVCAAMFVCEPESSRNASIIGLCFSNSHQKLQYVCVEKEQTSDVGVCVYKACVCVCTCLPCVHVCVCVCVVCIEFGLLH